MKFKPTTYMVFFPKETLFFSSRINLPDVITDSLVELYGATRFRKLQLEGKDFWSLRQLHLNKNVNGMIRHQPVLDSHPVTMDSDVEMNDESSSGILLILFYQQYNKYY